MGFLNRNTSSAGTTKRSAFVQPTSSLPPQRFAAEFSEPAASSSKPSRKWGWRFLRSSSHVSQSTEPVDGAYAKTGHPSTLVPPPQNRTSSTDTPDPNNLAKSLARKSRMLKTSASKLSLKSNFSSSSIWSANSREPEKSWRSSSRQDQPLPPLPGASSGISSPTRFQHLAHAVPAQFNRIQGATQSDLVAEFSALRASQSSRRDFRGINTVDLHSRDGSIDTNGSSSVTSSVVSSSKSSAIISLHSDTSYTSNSSMEKLSQFSPSLPTSQSRDSFSQPLPGYTSPAISGPSQMIPPPRTSSRKAVNRSEHKLRHPESGSRGGLGSQSINDKGKNESLRPVSRFSAESNSYYHASTYDPYDPAETSFYSSSLGEPLPCVAEETMSRTPSPSSYPHKRNDEYQGRWLRPHSKSPRSSSQDSNITITPTDSYQHPTRKPLPPTPAKIVEATHQRRSMQRSSLNEGLFTSWSFDEEPGNFPIKTSANQLYERPQSELQIRKDDLTRSPDLASLRNQTPTPTQHMYQAASLRNQTPTPTQHMYQAASLRNQTPTPTQHMYQAASLRNQTPTPTQHMYPAASLRNQTPTPTQHMYQPLGNPEEKQARNLGHNKSRILGQTQYYYRHPTPSKSAKRRDA